MSNTLQKMSQQQQQFLLDYTCDGAINVSKAFLTALTGDKNKAFELYCAYIRDFMLISSEDNLSALKRCGPDTAEAYMKSLFKVEAPKESPAFFPFLTKLI